MTIKHTSLVDFLGALQNRGTIKTLDSHPSTDWFDLSFISPVYKK
ncbi:hypothetical protein pah_c177o004 [Parachlamydia acanthamoebae str. Hall's coccus]|nr:hypothetical protein pah_c177o004 [Parachlamydia acanthamoebae str. Hall's coccus]